MKLRKIAIILATSVVLNGCSDQTGPYTEGTIYGISRERWEIMSPHQRDHAREVFDLENEKLAEQRKLDALKVNKANADANRKQEQDEEQEQINRQQRKVTGLQSKQVFKQKQREQELDTLKESSVKPNRS